MVPPLHKGQVPPLPLGPPLTSASRAWWSQPSIRGRPATSRRMHSVRLPSNAASASRMYSSATNLRREGGGEHGEGADMSE